MFMHVYISHSKRAITISFFIQYILQNVSDDTIFFKSNNKKNNYLINIHKKISNCTIFLNFFWGEHVPEPS